MSYGLYRVEVENGDVLLSADSAEKLLLMTRHELLWLSLETSILDLEVKSSDERKWDC